jgi:hypothetical protein
MKNLWGLGSNLRMRNSHPSRPSSSSSPVDLITVSTASFATEGITSNGLKCVATGIVATFSSSSNKTVAFLGFLSRALALHQLFPVPSLNSAATTSPTFRSHGDPPVPFPAVKMRMISLTTLAPSSPTT